MDIIAIGPSSTMEYLTNDYGHGRNILQILRAIKNDMINLADHDELDYAFAENDYIVLKYTSNNDAKEQWLAVKKQFVYLIQMKNNEKLKQ